MPFTETELDAAIKKLSLPELLEVLRQLGVPLPPAPRRLQVVTDQHGNRVVLD